VAVGRETGGLHLNPIVYLAHLAPRLCRTFAALVLAAPALAPAAPVEPPPGELCKPAEYKAFDFALGHFRMTAHGGPLAGHLRMTPMLLRCAVRGHWRGAIAGRGEVTTWYDRFQQRWHQLYINDDGHPLMMSGGVQDGALVFTGVNTFFDGRVGLHRMSWSPLPGGGLRQHWELSMDDGKTWETLIDARGRRMGAAKPVNASPPAARP
jgi:hypothetical protein